MIAGAGNQGQPSAPTPILRRRAFSLVEMLVVIGIVALLIGVLLPVVVKARRHALQVACLSNLRQLGCALIAYANESGGRFPSPASAVQPQAEDWVHWHANRDDTESRLWRHLGGNLAIL